MFHNYIHSQGGLPSHLCKRIRPLRSKIHCKASLVARARHIKFQQQSATLSAVKWDLHLPIMTKIYYTEGEKKSSLRSLAKRDGANWFSLLLLAGKYLQVYEVGTLRRTRMLLSLIPAERWTRNNSSMK